MVFMLLLSGVQKAVALLVGGRVCRLSLHV